MSLKNLSNNKKTNKPKESGCEPITISVSQAVKNWIDDMAKRTAVSRSYLVTAILTRFVKDEQAKQKT